ncbi:hypothetical protein PV726_42960 [Streptomyces europaeiscabiei]|uniref:hypothetical protein n=1 Tax=Streptomyces europaeiscabiei TaxID=146819 RepID=UPI0029BA517C|nr:hypothetical protein [Streptomyces europaeiscabiei]MDX3696892.1 hypothetical protein [Streptomyces europaeiscabiei]
MSPYVDRNSMKAARAKLHEEKNSLYEAKNAMSRELEKLFERLKSLGRASLSERQQQHETRARITDLKEQRRRISERIYRIKEELDRIRMNLGPPGGGIYTPRRRF